MELALRDKVIQRLKREINENKKNVLGQLNDLNKSSDENHFLKNVKRDYTKYRDHIVMEKNKQKEFMELLIEYIENTLDKSDITSEINQRALLEQNNILRQINNIKTEIDEIIR